MSFNQQVIHFKSIQIHLLCYDDFQIKSFLNLLNEEEIVRLNQFKSETRKKEFVATRILFHSIFPNQSISYNEMGAPFLKSGPFISISHSKSLVGIAINDSFAIALDLEFIQDKAMRLKDKFLDDSEQCQLNLTDEVELTKAWSAKETLYKLANKKEIIFKTDLRIQPIDGDNWGGTIFQKNKTIETSLHFLRLQNTIITFNQKACEIK